MGKRAVQARKEYAQRVRLVVGNGQDGQCISVGETPNSKADIHRLTSSSARYERVRLVRSGEECIAFDSAIPADGAVIARIERVNKEQMLGKGVALFPNSRKGHGVRVVTSCLTEPSEESVSSDMCSKKTSDRERKHNNIANR